MIYFQRISLVPSVGEKEDDNSEENEGVQVHTSRTTSRELRDTEGSIGNKEKDIEASPPPPPVITFPDGGVRAWSNIAGCTLVSLTAFGTYFIFLGTSFFF